MSFYAVVLWSRTMKNSPRPLFFLHQTLQSALCIGAGSIFQASAKHKFNCRTARWWSVIHHSKERVSTAPESNGGELYTTPADAWHCAWWSYACVQLLGHGNPIHKAPDEAQGAVWNSEVSVVTEDRWFLDTMLFSTWQWACVAYHFAAEPLLLLDVSTSK